jgi:hypothetical protein
LLLPPTLLLMTPAIRNHGGAPIAATVSPDQGDRTRWPAEPAKPACD